MFYLRTLYSTLSTSNPEELKSERAHVCNETMSEAEAKLEVFENACMHPLSDAEDVQVRTNNGQSLLSAGTMMAVAIYPPRSLSAEE